jgi:3-phenylpropionate/cinnamic acid dioxygenase small subunit
MKIAEFLEREFIDDPCEDFIKQFYRPFYWINVKEKSCCLTYQPNTRFDMIFYKLMYKIKNRVSRIENEDLEMVKGNTRKMTSKNVDEFFLIICFSCNGNLWKCNENHLSSLSYIFG